ncbi:MAG: hypothetical protein E7167_04180 [Firmicutes bacterium]|nr:hypothetical protein [Bacillota bacterium]
MKNNKKLFILIGIILIILIVVLIIIRKPEKTLPLIENNECIKKGNVCSLQDIKNGVYVDVEVNDKKSYGFYVISNTENEMTLIMNENIADNIDWHHELINMKGPLEALGQLSDYTYSWTKIDIIDNYTYDDYGKKYSDKLCEEGSNPGYSCKYSIYKTRGYNKIVLSKDEKYVDFNFAPEEEEPLLRQDLSDFNLRARLITVEEVNELANAKWLDYGLKDNEGYWTLSSSTAANTRYAVGAYAVVKAENGISVESLFIQNSLNEELKIGIRPVISIEKR